MAAQPHLPHLRKRLVVAAALLALAGWVASSDALRQWMNEILTVAEEIVRRHPNAGMLTFVALAAVSAILAFFSSAVIVPLGVKAWGETSTCFLLWLGWLLGGALTYAVGRFLGRGTIRLLVSEERVAWYEERVGKRLRFPTVLLFQLALPSEIPGYVLGTLRYPFTRYLLALALAELPFAIGATYLGWTFLRGSYILLLVAGAAGIAISAAALHHFHARIRS
ncbi:MAG TPA: VTT domain-containing protein [Thermoanaerobaculia bacterium]|nr:VTT domain-containing protein [Thermoanaerobaculia bacterium]